MKKFLTLVSVLAGVGLCQAQNFTASFTSAQEVPPNNNTGTDGTYAFANFSLNGTTLSVSSAFYGNSAGAPTAITINDAPPGANGPVLFDLTINNDETTVNGGFIDGSFTGSGTLTAGEITDLENGDLYANLETAALPQGEVRGQILSAVPEPGTITLMTVGSLSWLAMRRKKS